MIKLVYTYWGGQGQKQGHAKIFKKLQNNWEDFVQNKESS